MATELDNPFPYFSDRKGDALDQGYIYIGEANKDPELFPIDLFWDEALTIPAAQPLRTIAGYVVNPGAGNSPADIYTAEYEYSIRVRDRRSAQVFYEPDAQNALAGPGGSDLVGFIQVGTGAVFRTVQGKLRDVVSVKDYGAVGDQTTNDTADIQAGLDHQDTSYLGSFQMTVPDGNYTISGTGDRILEIQNGTSLIGSSLEGTWFRVDPASTALSALEDNGNGAKIELRNFTIYGGNNTSLTTLYKLGVRAIQTGTWGRYDNLTARNAPNATGFHFDANILSVGTLNTQDTRDGVITEDAGSGFQANTIYSLGWSRYGFKMGGIGDCVVNTEFEAPTSDDAICIYGSREFVAGFGTQIVAPGENRVVKTVFTYDPAFMAGITMGPWRFIRRDNTSKFGNPAAPADSGTATAVSANTLTDSTKNWARNQWKGAAVFITSGTGTGNWLEVASNSKTTITVATSSWTNGGTAPIIGSGYALDYAAKAIGGGGHMTSHAMTLPDAAILQLSTVRTTTDEMVLGRSADAAPIKGIMKVVAALDFPSVAAGGVQALTANVAGAQVSMPVALGVPFALQAVAGMHYSAAVSAAGVVSVYAKNTTGGAIDPPSATFVITVFDY